MQNDARRLRWLKCSLTLLGFLLLAIPFLQIARRPRGDFPRHWEFGRRLVAGEFIYGQGLNVPYLPFWALAHATLTILPAHAAQIAAYPLFLAALLLLLGTLQRLTWRQLPLQAEGVFWCGALSLILSARWLFRDMTECGVNLALVALCWLAILLWTRRREWAGGICLGLAASLKCTPLAFCAYFLWKRQWKMSGISLLTTAAFTLSPALFMGQAAYGRAMSHWLYTTQRGLREADPSQGVLGEVRLQNFSLRPAIGQSLMQVPPTHRSFIDHPLRPRSLNLRPEAAGRVAGGVMLAIALIVAWRMRRPVRTVSSCPLPQGGEGAVEATSSTILGGRDDLAVLWECAAISLAMLLYSPITWGQHCVGVIPAFYLLFRSVYSAGRLPTAAACFLVAYACLILLLNREIVGRETMLLLFAWRVPALCNLALLTVAMVSHGRCAITRTDSQSIADAASLPLSRAAS